MRVRWCVSAPSSVFGVGAVGRMGFVGGGVGVGRVLVGGATDEETADGETREETRAEVAEGIDTRLEEVAFALSCIASFFLPPWPLRSSCCCCLFCRFSSRRFRRCLSNTGQVRRARNCATASEHDASIRDTFSHVHPPSSESKEHGDPSGSHQCTRKKSPLRARMQCTS